MALPSFIVRDYAGGAAPLQLSANIGPTDLTFTLVGDFTDWPDGVPGPFSISIDDGLGSLEKMLCSAFNTSTGLLNVYTNGVDTGRGYDGTDAVAHIPQPTIQQVRPCWTAIEASEANTVAYLVKGSPHSIGNFLTFGSGGPAWAPLPAAPGFASDLYALFGEAGALVGSPPAASSGQFLTQTGVFTGTTDSFGDLIVTFPVAFPNGVIGVHADLSNITAGFFQIVTCPGNVVSTTSFVAEVWQGTPGVAPARFPNASVAIYWTAVGF